MVSVADRRRRECKSKEFVMKLRSISAGAAAFAAISLGAVGVAGAVPASGNPSGHGDRAARVAHIESVLSSGKLPSSFDCSTAAARQAKITSTEARINALLATAQARETAAANAGNSARAAAIASRISKAQTFLSDLGTLSQMITTHCG
jgi:hypothetical protein